MIFLIVAALTFIVGLNLFAYLSSQVCLIPVLCIFVFAENDQAYYVSLAMNAFTGVHSLCIFAVLVWYIYRLKVKARVVIWTENALSRRKEALIKMITPLYKSDRSRHYKRTIYL